MDVNSAFRAGTVGISASNLGGRQVIAPLPKRLQRTRVVASQTVRRCVATRAAAEVEPSPEQDLPPGSLGWPLLGESIECFSDSPAFHRDRYKMYGPVYKTNLLFTNVACIHDKEEIKRLLQGEGKLTEPHNFPHMQRLLGSRSLLWMTGRQHQQSRRILSLAFNRDAITYYMASLEEVAERRMSRWAQKEKVGAVLEFKDLAFDVATIVLISDMPEDTFRAFRNDYDTMMKGMAWFPLEVPGTRFWKAVQAHRRIRERISVYVREALKAASEGKRRSGLPTALDLMVNATDEEGNKVSEEELIDQCILQLLAGHETTGSTMARMVQALQRHPEVLQKLRQEQEEVVAKFGDAFTPDVLDSMPYAEAVMKETMRVWPTVPQVTRKSLVDLDVMGYRIPKGWHMLLMLDGSIKNIEEFNDDRAVFRPERWLDLKKDPKGYYPFGEGPHICLGMALAKAEMMVVLGKLAREFQWQLDDPDEVWLPFGGSINGLQTSFKKLPAQKPPLVRDPATV